MWLMNNRDSLVVRIYHIGHCCKPVILQMSTICLLVLSILTFDRESRNVSKTRGGTYAVAATCAVLAEVLLVSYFAFIKRPFYAGVWSRDVMPGSGEGVAEGTGVSSARVDQPEYPAESPHVEVQGQTNCVEFCLRSIMVAGSILTTVFTILGVTEVDQLARNYATPSMAEHSRAAISVLICLVCVFQNTWVGTLILGTSLTGSTSQILMGYCQMLAVMGLVIRVRVLEVCGPFARMPESLIAVASISSALVCMAAFFLLLIPVAAFLRGVRADALEGGSRGVRHSPLYKYRAVILQVFFLMFFLLDACTVWTIVGIYWVDGNKCRP